MSYQNQDLFKGSAWYYARFRPSYPEEVLSILKQSFHLHDHGTLLDLGCGPGDLAISLSKYFFRVYAVDIDKEMLSEGEKRALTAGVQNIEWILGRSEDFSDTYGHFNLVTIGKAFHWMEKRAVLTRFHPLIEKGGGIALIGERGRMWSGKLDWQVALVSVIKKYLGNERRAGTGLANLVAENWRDLLQESFGNVKSAKVNITDCWTIDTLLGFLYSTSYCSKGLLGENVPIFENDVKNTLFKIHPSGIFKEPISIDVLTSLKY